jgi:tyrosine-protein kinase Etk/Wzc
VKTQGDRPESSDASPRGLPVPVVEAMGNGGRGDGDDGAATIVYYLGVLAEGRWLILGALVAAAIGLGAYLWLVTPTYRADVILRAEERTPNTAPPLTDVTALLEGPQTVTAETEIEVLQSRALLGSVVDELNLDVLAVPRYFPIIGQAIARGYKGPGVRPAMGGLSRYAWGGERVGLGGLVLPSSVDDETVRLTLVAGQGGRYTLLDESGAPLLAGEVGKPSEGDVRLGGADEKMLIFVRELRARPGTQFLVKRESKGAAYRNLLESLKLAEKGRKTGVISVSMEGADRFQIVTILNTLANNYLRYNVERRSAEAERTLAFLNTQMPVLRDNLYSAEATLEHYKTKNNLRVDLSLATKDTLDRAIDLDKRLSELELQQKETRTRFTDTHPIMESLKQKISQINAERDELNKQIQRLPEAESNSVRLMRDVKVANELYVTLLNKAQELNVMKSGLLGNVRILDLAVRPDVPATPRKGEAAALALAAGLLGGIVLAFLRKALKQGIVDPADAERAVGIPVRAVLPRSRKQAALQRGARGKGDRWPILAAVDTSDVTVEAVRSLRTSLQFSLSEAPNHVISIGGPRPDVGKSFVTVNLARVFADAGVRVLVIDADLRHGALHRYLAVERSPGLADLVTGATGLESALHHTDLPSIDFVPRGASTSNPSELLGSQRFRQLVDDLSKSYDVVIVDLPPILAVTDGALAARVAGTNLLVLRAGWHPVREIQQAVRRYAENGVQVDGLVLNGMVPDRGPSRYGGHHYQYSYK